jgi:TnpA family transposase
MLIWLGNTKIKFVSSSFIFNYVMDDAYQRRASQNKIIIFFVEI